MSHTPGPWMVGKKDNPIGYLPIFARTGVTKINCIAKTDAHEVGFGISQEEMESNARLIAAAPDLLAALEYIVHWDKDKWNPETARDMAKSAIFAAKGE